MIVTVPTRPDWARHIQLRAQEARTIGLLFDNSIVKIELGGIFIPRIGSKLRLGEVGPDTTLGELSGRAEGLGWQPRPDLFDEAAAWMLRQFRSDEAYLVAEAGFSKVGDPILSTRPHFVFSDRVFLAISIGRSRADEIAQTLRWARSWRLLGAVLRSPHPQVNFDSAQRVLFFCDILDCDSLAEVSVLLP